MLVDFVERVVVRITPAEPALVEMLELAEFDPALVLAQSFVVRDDPVAQLADHRWTELRPHSGRQLVKRA